MNKKIYIDRDMELTPHVLTKIIRFFNTYVKPQIDFNYGYYDGTGQAIMSRVYEDATKPANKIVKNYCKSIVDNYRGYICGVPITYSAGSDDSDISLLLECNRLNDVEQSDSEWLKNALITGVGYQLCYVNESLEKKFKNIDPRAGFPIYSADLDEELLYFVSFTPIIDWNREDWDDRWSVSVYDKTYINHYEADSSFSLTAPISEPEAHYFQQVPFAIFNLNDDGTSIFEAVISLQDAYNKLLSDEVNDFEGFVDAYMVLKNLTATEDDLAAMKESRTILLDDDSDAYYLTKSISDTQIQNLLDSITTSIHTVSNSPDFSSSEFNNGVSSGIAIQYKLVGFNNIAANIETNFKKAIQERIELLNNVFSLVETTVFDVNITFTHNLPNNIADTVNVINQLRGIVSDKTLIGLLPFINDVDQEMIKVKDQNGALADLYSNAFTTTE